MGIKIKGITESTNRIELGKDPFQIRGARDFLANDKGIINRSHSKLAPAPKDPLNSIPSAGNQPEDILKMDLGKSKAELSPFSLSSAKLYKKFFVAAFVRDANLRWLKRINWGMYFQRRLLDERAAEDYFRFTLEMRHRLLKQMEEWRDLHFKLNRRASHKFIAEAKLQVNLRNEDRELEARNQLNQRREGIRQQVEIAQNNANIRDKLVEVWRSLNRDVKQKYFSDAEWQKESVHQLLDGRIEDLLHRRAETGKKIEAFIKASVNLRRDELQDMDERIAVHTELRDQSLGRSKMLEREVKQEYFASADWIDGLIQELLGDQDMAKANRHVEILRFVDKGKAKVAEANRSYDLAIRDQLKENRRELDQNQIKLNETAQWRTKILDQWRSLNRDIAEHLYYEGVWHEGLSHELLSNKDFKTRLRTKEAIQLVEKFLQQTADVRRELLQATGQKLAVYTELRDEALYEWKAQHRELKNEFFAEEDWEIGLKKEGLENLADRARYRHREITQQAEAFLRESRDLPRTMVTEIAKKIAELRPVQPSHQSPQDALPTSAAKKKT